MEVINLPKHAAKIFGIFFATFSMCVAFSSPAFAAGVAQIGSTTYSTITEAISAAGTDETTITILANTTESIIIPVGANITLDLNGKEIVNSSATSHTIENRGTLILKSSVPGGVVDNENDNVAALFNEVGGIVTINGDLAISKTKDDGTEANSWYNIVNRSTMTINDGVIVHNPGSQTSTLTNGFLNVATYFPDVPPVHLTINGGTFSGGKNTIKNDSGGVLVINGGTFTNANNPTLLNWNIATINGGTFNSPKPIIVGKYERTGANVPTVPTEQGILNISGGDFTGTTIIAQSPSGSNVKTSEITVSGGTFNGNLPDLTPATVTASGGEFRDPLPDTVIIPADKKVTVSGGYFIIGDIVTPPSNNPPATTIPVPNTSTVKAPDTGLDIDTGSYVVATFGLVATVSAAVFAIIKLIKRRAKESEYFIW